MIKGVSKNVIEVRSPNSRYFERAILILRDVPPPEPIRLRTLADAYLRESERSYRSHLALRLTVSALRFVLSACCGAAVTVLLLQGL